MNKLQVIKMAASAGIALSAGVGALTPVNAASTSIRKCQIVGYEKDYYYDDYDGDDVSVVLKKGSKILKEGRDYNTDVTIGKKGKGVLIINGKGKYKGTIVKNFRMHYPETDVTVQSEKTGVRVRWDKVLNVSKYVVWRDGVKVKTISGNGELEWKDTHVKNGRHYVYSVQTVGTRYSSSYSEPGSGSQTTWLATPKIKSVTRDGDSVTVRWAKNKTATGYNLSFNSDTADENISVGRNKTSYTFDGEPNTKYRVFVSCYQKNKLGTYSSSISAWKAV